MGTNNSRPHAACSGDRSQKKHGQAGGRSTSCALEAVGGAGCAVTLTEDQIKKLISPTSRIRRTGERSIACFMSSRFTVMIFHRAEFQVIKSYAD